MITGSVPTESKLAVPMHSYPGAREDHAGWEVQLSWHYFQLAVSYVTVERIGQGCH